MNRMPRTDKSYGEKNTHSKIENRMEIGTILNRVFRKGLLTKVTFEQQPKSQKSEPCKNLE